MEFTSLPNLHPAFVHFPIALVPLALLFEVVGLFWRKTEWLSRAAAAVWLLAGVAAFAAYQTGEAAADGLAGVPALVEPLIGTHSDWGHRLFYGLAVFALLRLGAEIWDKERRKTLVRWGLLVPELTLLALVAYTADLGGELVYQHGVAVTKSAPDGATGELQATSGQGEDAPEAGSQTVDPSERLQSGEDGTTVWRPAPGDGAALGSVVTALGDTTLDSVRATGEGGEGLSLAVSGTSWLALPGTFGDVRVEAEIDIAGFDGEIGLFHHAQGPEAAGLLVHGTGGVQRLLEFRGERSELDSVDAALPDRVFVLAVSSAGKHLKGLVDGATVTHGHIEPGPEGRVGLLLRGEGTVRLVRLSAQPL